MVKIERDKIKKRIKELGYTVTGVAMRAKISPNTLHQMIHSTTYGTPSLDKRKRLARVLEGSEDDFFTVVARGEEAS